MPNSNKDESCKEIHRLEYLVANPFYADLKFIMVHDGNIEIPAHKIIVSSISNVMCKMIFGLQSNDFTKTHLEVRKTTASAFIEVLRYIYTEKVHITTKNVIDMLTVSNFYAIEKLEKQCIEFLSERINTKNVCTMYFFYSTRYGNGKLAKYCEQIIQKSTRSAFSKDLKGFYLMDVNMIKELLKLDALSISELDLFKALLIWAENACIKRHLDINAANKRKVLDGAEQLLRFRTLTFEQFEDCIRLESQLFNETQIEDIKNCIKNKNSTNEMKRKLYCCQDLTWKHRTTQDNHPPDAVFAYPETCTFLSHFLGRALYKQNFVPIIIKPWESAATYYADDYSEVNFESYEVMCGDGYKYEQLENNELPYNVVVIDNEADEPMFIYREMDRFGTESLCNFRPNDSHKNYEVLVGYNVKSPLPNGVIPDDAVVGGHVDGVEQLICKVYHEGDILPARIGRGQDFAVVSYSVAVFQKEEFAYLRMDNVEWVAAANGNVPTNAMVGGRNTTGELLYIGRVKYLNDLVPGKIQPSHFCIYFASNGSELSSRLYEVLVEKTN